MKWIRILVLVAAIGLFFDWAKDTKFVKDMFPDLEWDYKWDDRRGKIWLEVE